LERILEGIGHSIFEVLAGKFPERTEKNCENYPARHPMLHPRFKWRKSPQDEPDLAVKSFCKPTIAYNH
jgi:hypothetical protein